MDCPPSNANVPDPMAAAPVVPRDLATGPLPFQASNDGRNSSQPEFPIYERMSIYNLSQLGQNDRTEKEEIKARNCAFNWKRVARVTIDAILVIGAGVAAYDHFRLWKMESKVNALENR